MTAASPDTESATLLLGIVADVLRGVHHSRRTIVTTTRRSLATADRWIEQIAATVPGVRKVRDGRTTVLVFETRRDLPTKTAAVGACVAASLGSLFEGSQQERNLKDARDYLLRLRGESYGDLDRKFFFATKGGECSLPEKREELDEIIDALLGNRTLHFSYVHNNGAKADETIEPLSLVIFDHQFYVLCRRPEGTLYAYRFARMSAVEATNEAFAYPSKNEFDPRNVFGSIFGIHVSSTGQIEEVEAVLDEPWATYAMSHRWHPSQEVRRIGDGRVRVVIRTRLCREVETWALGFGEQAEIVRPAALRVAVARRLGAGADRYEARPPIAKAGTKSSAASRRIPKGDVAKAKGTPRVPSRRDASRRAWGPVSRVARCSVPPGKWLKSHRTG